MTPFSPAQDLSQRGAPLEYANNALWVAGAGGNTYSILDPNGLTLEVWVKNPSDDTANNILDIYHVVVDNGFVFATAGVGGCSGGTCAAPGDNMALTGCYRMGMGRSNFPLGPFDYILNDLNSDSMPSNSHEYAKVLVNPNDDVTNFYGQYLGTRPPPGYSLPSGFQAVSVPSAANPGFFFGSNPCLIDQPSPNWGERAGVCVQSCGQLGGEASYSDSCYNHGRVDAGTAYDTPYCCGPLVTCGGADHPSPDWGVKDGMCLRSCGGVGGTVGETSACQAANLIDAGKAYDAPYCCKSAPCPQAGF